MRLVGCLTSHCRGDDFYEIYMKRTTCAPKGGNKMKRYFLLLILILSLVLTGCSQGSKPVVENTPVSQKEKLVITDMLGRQVEIPE